MPRRPSLAAWLARHLRPTDGPGAGRRLTLEPWQRGFLHAVDREHKPIVSLMAASQIGKTLLALGIGIRAAVDGQGCLLASATEVSVRDLARRLDSTLEHAPALGTRFPSPRSGPGARASWKDRRVAGGGWIGLAASGSASQLASRTVKIALADEVSRWPARVRSGEGHPVALLRARLSDWGDEGRLLAISSPVHPADAIALMFRDGDRRRVEYLCQDCNRRTPFGWDQVTGRGRGEQPMIACLHCGTLHDERARRRMLRSGVWVPQKSQPTDEGSISFQLGRLDSARASLGAIVQEFRRSSRAAARGDPRAAATFRNVCLGCRVKVGAPMSISSTTSAGRSGSWRLSKSHVGSTSRMTGSSSSSVDSPRKTRSSRSCILASCSVTRATITCGTPSRPNSTRTARRSLCPL